MRPKLAVIIATKNRAEAIECYALSSLANQTGDVNFLCVVWDASDNDATQKIIESRDWSFPVEYFRATRIGSSSQRNDAIAYVLTNHSDVRFVVFMDDDCELSPDALDGVCKTFETTNADLVNIPMRPKGFTGKSETKSFKSWVKHCLGMNRHGATKFLYNYGTTDEANGIEVDWASGCGMAFRIEIFRDDGYFFPEVFQHFGGYALGEDFALTFFLCKKMSKHIFNSVEGYGIHHAASGGRLNVTNMAAAKWYNFHLLFNALYEDGHGIRKNWLVIKFKLFMMAAMLKLLIRARSLDLSAVLRGVREAKVALVEYSKNFNSGKLFGYDIKLDLFREERVKISSGYEKLEDENE